MFTSLNNRQELFARAIAEGHSQKEAYERAGYHSESNNAAEANASRLIRNDKVRRRIAELRAEHAKRNAVSVDSLTKKLEVLYGLAFANKQTGAAVAAVGLMAKIHGFITDRAQVEHTVMRKPSRDRKRRPG